MNHLNPTQVEQLKEIGAHLRQYREEQSISTEEVAAKTFIPLRLLKALEEGQLDQLPEPIFVQGFIRRYADAIDLDGAALAQTFPTTLFHEKSDAPSQELSTPPSRTIKPYQLYIVLGVFGVTLVSGLLYLFNRLQTANHPIQKKNPPMGQPQKYK
jgi:cytoskeletal protein RodZ